MDTGDMTRYVSIFPLFSKMDHSHIFLSFKESTPIVESPFQMLAASEMHYSGS